MLITGAGAKHAMSPASAADSLRRGEFVLLYDSESRENEVDMVVAAEHATPEHVARMRRHAGGVLCAAIDGALGKRMGLRYMHEMLLSDEGAAPLARGASPYGDMPTFSVSVNHRSTYTGVTDRDRAATIREVAALHGSPDPRADLVSGFRAPGHVPLLLASEGLLGSRQGHTEMSVYLARLAGLSPAAAICEMMDSETYSALSPRKAREFAAHNGAPFLDGRELLEYARVN